MLTVVVSGRMDKKDEQLKSLNQESARSQQEYAHKRKEVTTLIINQSNQKREG